MPFTDGKYLSFSDSLIIMTIRNSSAYFYKSQVLDVTRCNNISSVGLGYAIARLEYLEQLNASYCLKVGKSFRICNCKYRFYFDDIDVGHMQQECSGFLCSLNGLKKLKTIKVDGSTLSGTILNALSKHCPLLEEIGLGKVKGLTDTDLVQLAHSSVKLQSINLTCCNTITDSAICALAVSCRNLRFLKLESCSAITKNSLLALGTHCKNLKELDLTDCGGVDDEGTY